MHILGWVYLSICGKLLQNTTTTALVFIQCSQLDLGMTDRITVIQLENTSMRIYRKIYMYNDVAHMYMQTHTMD